MQVIAVCNNKGGVGKTTTTASTAAALVRKGYRVLVVDVDGQSNLSYSLSAQDFAELPTVADTLIAGKPLPIYPVREGLDLVPASFGLSKAEVAGISTDTLKKALSSLRGYDYAIIDTAPGVGLLTLSALTAADAVVITLTAEALPAQGMQTLEEVIAAVGARTVGYLITRYNSRLSLSKAVVEALRKRLGALLFGTMIRENVALAEAPFSRTDIFTYAPKSNGAKDYAAFANELVKRLKTIAV